MSGRGRKQIKRLARFLTRSGRFAPGEIWHSPLPRSRETAQRLVERLGLKAKLVQIDGINGDDDPSLAIGRLSARKAKTPIAIVGHEPHLSAFTTLLVTGAAAPVRFKLKKAAVVALERTDEGGWQVRWQLSPEIVK